MLCHSNYNRYVPFVGVHCLESSVHQHAGRASATLASLSLDHSQKFVEIYRARTVGIYLRDKCLPKMPTVRTF